MLLTDPQLRPVIAHRGASAYAPENTVAAFDLALDLGAEALEMDVRLTSDGVAVIHHDPTLFRTTNTSAPVGALRHADLSAVDAGARFTADEGRTFPFRGRGIRVPTLAEILSRYAGVPILLEVKEPKAARVVRAVLEDARAAATTVIAAFDAESLLPFREPPWLRGASTSDAARLWLPATLGLRHAPPESRALSVPLRWHGLPVITPGFVRAARAAGVPVHVWTVDDPAVATGLWKRGVSGIVTNAPDVIARAKLQYERE